MWKTVELVDACDLITCGVAKRPEYVESGIPFLSAKNVKKQKVIWDDYKYITSETHRTLTKHNKPEIGDVLYTRVGSFGEAAIVDKDVEFSIFVSLTLIKPKPILLNKFLTYYLNSPVGKSLAKKGVSSSGVGNLNVAVVRKFPIPLPPLEEQQRIVDKLDTAFAEIEETINNFDIKYSKLNILKEIFLINKIKNFKNGKSFKLNELCHRITDGSHNPPKKINNSSFIMLSSRNIFDDNINFDNPRYISEQDFISENKRTDVSQGDVLLTIVGTIGRCAVVNFQEPKFTLQRSVAVFKPNKLINSKFLMYLLQSLIAFLNSESKGAAQQGIYLKQLKNIEVQIPSLSEQLNIVNKIDGFYVELKKLDNLLTKQKENYNSLIISILNNSIFKEAA